MSYDAKTERLISIKKLSGKAQTSNDKGLSNEGLPSGLTLASSTVFGQAISTSPSSTALYTITGQVEYLRFPSTFIAGSDTSSGRHGFELKLPSDYEANSSNAKAGTYPFINDQVVNITSGSLQLISPPFATSYEAKPFYGGTSAKDTGTQIPILDARDWYMDYFNGILFQQDPPGTGDHAENADYVEAYLYIGDMLDTVVAGAGGGSGDSNAQYLVLQATGSLSAERVLTMGTGMSSADAGAGGNFTVSVDNSIVATLTGSQFSGNVGITGSMGSTTTITSPAFSGSLTHLQDGTSYILAGTNISVASASNGSITITSADTTYSAGDGIDLSGTIFSTDLKTSGGLKIDSTELAIDDSVVATISGSTFTGIVNFSSGLSGSLTRLHDGTSYLVAGSNVTIASASNGSVTISSTGGGGSGGGDAAAEYLVLSATGSLSSERVFTMSTGLSASDAGPGGAYSLSIDDSIVATLTGSQFSGNVGITGSLGATTIITSPAISGSLTNLSDGTSYIKAGVNITVTSGSDGAITIAGATQGGGTGDANVEYIVSELSGSVPNAKLIESGPGITIVTGSNSLTISSDSSSINGRSKQSYVVTSSHPANSQFKTPFSNFSEVLFDKNLIDIYLNGQLLHSGTEGEVASSDKDYTVFTSGSVKLAFNLLDADQLDVMLSKLTTGDGGADPAAQYLVLETTGSLSAERVLTMGTGLLGVDSGAGSPFTLNIDNSIVATLTGSQFSGNVGVTGSIGATLGISGSLTRLTDGSSYLVAGSNVAIVSSSSGQVTISSTTNPSMSIYNVTSSHVSSSPLVLPDVDFTTNSRSFDKNQIFLNGVLMASGSTFDYTLDTLATGSIVFNMTLKDDDIIIVRQS